MNEKEFKKLKLSTSMKQALIEISRAGGTLEICYRMETPKNSLCALATRGLVIINRYQSTWSAHDKDATFTELGKAALVHIGETPQKARIAEIDKERGRLNGPAHKPERYRAEAESHRRQAERDDAFAEAAEPAAAVALAKIAELEKERAELEAADKGAPLEHSKCSSTEKEDAAV